jgi:hypothetical protein
MIERSQVQAGQGVPIVRVAHGNNELPAAYTRLRDAARRITTSQGRRMRWKKLKNVRAKERSLGNLWPASNEPPNNGPFRLPFPVPDDFP